MKCYICGKEIKTFNIRFTDPSKGTVCGECVTKAVEIAIAASDLCGKCGMKKEHTFHMTTEECLRQGGPGSCKYPSDHH